jgi:hypothetical protein
MYMRAESEASIEILMRQVLLTCACDFLFKVASGLQAVHFFIKGTAALATFFLLSPASVLGRAATKFFAAHGSNSI